MAITIDPAKLAKELRETLTTRTFWAYVFLAALVTLSLPDAAAAFLGIAKLREGLRPWLGAAALLSGIGLAVAQGHRIRAWWERKEKGKSLLRRLNNLSPNEKGLLKQYIDGATKTQYFDIQDGVAAGLNAAGILFRPTDVGDFVDGFAFNLQPWVWNHLQKNPQLLEGAAPQRPRETRRRI